MIGPKIKGLGEIVIRVKDMELMSHFYEHKLGLEVIDKKKGYSFFKVAEGAAGHHQVIALFDQSIPSAFGEITDSFNNLASSLHHFAFEIDKADYDKTLEELQASGIELKTQVFSWIKWKSIFFKDPESNIIELVCHDESIQ